ncbi:MAG: manganese efflux pump [Candidatus Eremiobacteraeota bacterium]|nr:manganese efflux pump [Candidatus Eremiobacteraeota bacterium]
MTAFLKVALIAFSLALDVFAVCVGVGVRGPKRAQRIRIGLAFASAEVGMNVLGALLGHVAGRLIGEVAAYIGFGALIVLGIYIVVESLREESGELDLSTGWGLLVGALSISMDSLGVGFTLPYLGVPIVASLATIFVVSLGSTATGLWVGRTVGTRLAGYAGVVSGVTLSLTGAGFAAARYFGIG